MENCKQAICLGLPILFPYAQVYKVWIFGKFDFPLEAFSHNFKIDSIPGNHPSILNNVCFLKKLDVYKGKSDCNWSLKSEAGIWQVFRVQSP